MPFSLDNKIALVTGSSRGLGAGIALCMAKAGAHVVVNSRTESEQGFSVVRQIKEMGKESFFIPADVGNKEDVQRLFTQVYDHFGHLDILVNNAGTSRAESIFETDLESWNEVLQINLTSTFLCSKKAIETMREKMYGRIINVSSMVGHRGAEFGHVHYASTKSGQLGFTKSLSRTAAPYNITVNAIAPGIIQTDLLTQTHGEEGVKELSEKAPLGLGHVDDVGSAAVYLASDEARYITGSTLDVNGGMYMR